MYPTKGDFNRQMEETSRDIHAKVEISYTDPSIDTTIQVSANENANHSYPEQTADQNEDIAGKIAALDSSWELDGTYELAPGPENQLGWWGSKLSGADGLFSEPFPTLTIEFASRPILAFQIVSDAERNEWPVDFDINLYSNDSLIYTENVEGNNGVTWYKELDEVVTQVTKMELAINRWSQESRQAKIVEFYSGIRETYERKDIMLINLLEEREISKGSLPVGNISSNEIDIRLYNRDRKFDAGNYNSKLYQLLRQNRKIKAWLGITNEEGDKSIMELITDTKEKWEQGELDNVVATEEGLELEGSNSTETEWQVYKETDSDITTNPNIYVHENGDIFYTTEDGMLYKISTDGSVTSSSAHGTTNEGAKQIKYYNGYLYVLWEPGEVLSKYNVADIKDKEAVFGYSSNYNILDFEFINNRLFVARRTTADNVTELIDHTDTIDIKHQMITGTYQILQMQRNRETEDRLIVAGGDGYIFCYELSSGTVIWSYNDLINNGADNLATVGRKDIWRVEYTDDQHIYVMHGYKHTNKTYDASFTWFEVVNSELDYVDYQHNLENYHVTDFAAISTEELLLYSTGYNEIYLFDVNNWDDFFSNKVIEDIPFYKDWAFTYNDNYLYGVTTSNDITAYKNQETVVLEEGVRNSYEIDISGVGLLDSSNISWQGTYLENVTIEVSVDGGVWQQCSNNQPIPGLEQGEEYEKLICRQTLTNEEGNRPILDSLTIEVTTIYGETTKEEIPLGVFWSGDWSAPEGEVYAQTTGRDRLQLFERSTYSSSQVKENVTLYELAVDVLEDYGLSSSEYFVDEELQDEDYIIPRAYIEPQTHREALRLIAEASLGQCFCDRDGKIRLEGFSYLKNKTISEIEITADNYFNKDNPNNYSELANYITVETQPLKPKETEEVYRSDEPVEILATETITITAYYNNEPCVDAVASIEGTGSISSATYYSWGAEIEITSDTDGTFELVVNAKPLEVRGSEKVKAKDDESIRDNGLSTYEFPNNPLVQTKVIAQRIANSLLEYHKNPRRDLTMDWRGNPALLLGDRTTITDKYSSEDFYVIRQNLEYDGALRADMEGRKA